MKIAFFITCLTDLYYPRSGIAAVKVLEHLGHTVEFPLQQTCCGQPMYNNGFHNDARDLAKRMIAVFELFDTVVTPSGSCAAMIREHYPSLFADDPVMLARANAFAAKTYEFSEFLANVLKVDLAATGVRWEGSVTYHVACHLRGLGLAGVAEGLLQSIPGIHFTPLPKSEQCCGFGGTFAVKYPQISKGMVEEKLACIEATKCPAVVCNEAGCCMNISGAHHRAHGNLGFRFTSLPEIIAEGLGLLERQEPAR